MPLPSGIDPADHHPDELRILNIDELRAFFARRQWVRPRDWDAINRREYIGDMRQFALSCFVHGYMTAKA